MKKNVDGFLGKIGLLTAERNREAQKDLSLAQICRAVLSDQRNGKLRTTFDFSDALRRGTGLITEIKRASPSQGLIAAGADAAAIAGQYLENGASALSVLTEPHFFGGSIEDLVSVRAAHPSATLLMKDFVVDPYQIYQARYFGADVVLLIVALLDECELREMQRLAHELGLSVLVETHNEEEFSMAQKLSCPIVGVNNRNLKTLQTDLAISRTLVTKKSGSELLVAESGIEDHATIEEFRSLGFEGFLVGTSLMRESSPGLALRRLVRGA